MKKRIKIDLLLLGIFLILLSCNPKNTEKNDQTAANEEQMKKENANEDLSKGFQLLESSCFSCHSPNANIKNKVAPTMATIKKHYITKGVSKEEFTKSFIEFLNNPVEEKAKIPQAVEQFGVMPKFNFSDAQLKQMANYIYNTELEAPDWYTNHYQKEKQKHKINLEDLSYVDLGKRYALSTKSVLGKNLKSAIKNKGTENAVEFCHERAYPLTDSMAIVLNAKIKRVSDQPRNPKNAANESELKYIASAKSILATQGKIKPQVQELNGKMVGYYPILTNKMCMQCHGKPNTDIQAATLEKLNALYPKDMARGYTENQLRGIWVVEMDKL
ncbi:MAG TPA: DUF3365 domain-containing protein [Phaeodactylibacter sp.]|nr:DUF3365 domain-containing protein [Phaeodactylibacter sp.]